MQRFDKNFLTKASLVSGILKYVLGLTYDLYEILIFQSQIFESVPLTKKVLKISAISFSLK